MTDDLHGVVSDDDVVEVEGRRIGVYDYIKVLPTPGNPRAFIGRVHGWWITDDGVITAIDVWGDYRKGRQRMRSVRPDQVQALSTRMQNQMRRADTDRAEAGK